ncbi:short-chain dehydrogenase/reductase SDR [Hyaloraphidium curvatum]|nr:short-chain dehydrogenase/reductase SDR [Hyaloraphidium curvatum]
MSASPSIPKKWDASKIPSQEGKKAIVTGANSGIGFPTALELARAGASVWLACRSPERAEEAVKKIQESVPGADLKWLPPLDLSSLESVKTFAEAVKKEWDVVDILCLNAGVMAIPTRTLTKDGFEMQFGTNHLGHFALASLVFDRVMKSPAPRVVNVSSYASNMASKLDFNNLPDWKTGYGAWTAYAASKLANLLFTHELQRRADAAAGGKSKLFVASAHPGYTATNLQYNGPQMSTGIMSYLVGFSNYLFGQSAEMGALPTLFAATEPSCPREAFIGPDGWAKMGGYPVLNPEPKLAADADMARQLWDKSEEWTGIKFDL